MYAHACTHTPRETLTDINVDALARTRVEVRVQTETDRAVTFLFIFLFYAWKRHRAQRPKRTILEKVY